MELEEFDEVVLFLAAANTFQVEDLAEVVVVAVGDVDQVRLYEGLWWGWSDLEGFQERFDLEEAAVHALDETCWGWSWKERGEAAFERVRVQEHLSQCEIGSIDRNGKENYLFGACL